MTEYCVFFFFLFFVVFFFFKQKTAYEITRWLEFRRVLFRSLYYFKIKLQCRRPMNLVFYDTRVLCFLPIRFEIRHNGLPEDAAWFPSSIFSKTLLKPNWWEIESSSQLSPPAGHIRLEQWILHDESLCWQNKSINLYPF